MLVSPMMSTTNKEGRPVDVEYGKKPFKVIAAIVAWSQVEPAFMEDLFGLLTSGVVNGFMCVQGTVLPGARNVACKKVTENFSDYTHLLFIDQDMCNITPDHIKRLIAANVDIVSPLMVRRKYPFPPACQPLDRTAAPILEELRNPANGNNPSLIECLHVGTGCMLIKREVIEALREPRDIWFANDRQVHEKEFKELINEKLQLYGIATTKSNEVAFYVKEGKHLGGVLDDIYTSMLEAQRSFDIQGEDVYFCLKAREKGFKVYVDCGNQIGHIGSTIFHIGHYVRAIQELQDKQGKDARFPDEHTKVNPSPAIVIP